MDFVISGFHFSLTLIQWCHSACVLSFSEASEVGSCETAELMNNSSLMALVGGGGGAAEKYDEKAGRFDLSQLPVSVISVN